MLFDQISLDIAAAMKAQDKVRLTTLRNVKKYFIEAKTAPGAGDTLADADALKILAKLAKQGDDTAALYREQGRPDLAAEEQAQADIIKEYMPRPLTADELAAALRDIIARVGATSPRDMGKVMGVAGRELAGKADGKAIADTVKQLLA